MTRSSAGAVPVVETSNEHSIQGAIELPATKKSPSQMGRGLLRRTDRWPLKWNSHIYESNFRGPVQVAGPFLLLGQRKSVIQLS